MREAERIQATVQIARKAEEVSLDVFASGEHHHPPFSSSPTTALLGEEVLRVLRQEMAARRSPGVPDAPTHDSLLRAKYGDATPRQGRPNANRGDNVTGTSPHQDSNPLAPARYPVLG